MPNSTPAERGRRLQMHLQTAANVLRGSSLAAAPISRQGPARAFLARRRTMPPSVGFMQPWDFIVVRDVAVRRRVRERLSRRPTRRPPGMFGDDRQQGLSQASSWRASSRRRSAILRHLRTAAGPGPGGAGAEPISPEMDLYRRGLCRAEPLAGRPGGECRGRLGSAILRHDDTERSPGHPGRAIQPIAYLCVGYVSHFFPQAGARVRRMAAPHGRSPEILWFEPLGMAVAVRRAFCSNTSGERVRDTARTGIVPLKVGDSAGADFRDAGRRRRPGDPAMKREWASPGIAI